ncbi:hypothetical protein ABH922_004930 [Rhodococcus sp. 27YEA15]|uniref:hypothetical protein n=1 Tax=Rhodococcus sp. 27YEA15 TaxID=3156259 RepID=UPI003C7CB22B
MATRIGRRLITTGAIAGMSALALLVNPAVGSAAITGGATVHANAGQGTITTAITGLNTTKAFVKCEGTVYRADASVLDSTTKVGQSYLIVGDTMTAGQILTNASGIGTSAVFPAGEYQVRTKCKEDGDTDYQDPIASVRVTVTTNGAPSTGSSDPGALLQNLVRGVLGTFGS